MKYLVFGKTGQVARELQRLPLNARFLSRQDADLSQPDHLKSLVLNAKADAVINAAAWTDVDGAESCEDLATVINGQAPAAIAEACAQKTIPFINISTDYVFDGQGSAPFTPGDITQPLGAYGRSKLAGEEGVRTAGGPYANLRTSWVFSAHGKNFVKTMLRLGAEREALGIVADQVGGPTAASAIAKACVRIADHLAQAPQHSGTYHFSGAPDVSWAEFARAVFEISGLTVRVNDIATKDFPTPAQRPPNSRLNCELTSEVFGIDRPDWRADLRRVIEELSDQK